MKKAEEYIKDFDYIEEDVIGVGHFEWIDEVEKRELIKVIKQVQIDAYNEALDDAAKNADAEFNPMGWLAEQHMNNPFIAGEDYEVYIITNSILKLKKQL